MRATIASQDDINAVVRIVIPGQGEHNEDFARVDGKWIPADMAKDWDKTIAEALEGLNELSSEEFKAMKPQIMQALTSLDGVIDQLHAAKTPEEFEQGLQMGMMQLFGMMMTMNREMN
jgi:hypothetical protein